MSTDWIHRHSVHFNFDLSRLSLYKTYANDFQFRRLNITGMLLSNHLKWKLSWRMIELFFCFLKSCTKFSRSPGDRHPPSMVFNDHGIGVDKFKQDYLVKRSWIKMFRSWIINVVMIICNRVIRNFMFENQF